jgi:A/G-specific adenine glycosylase
MMGTMRKGTKRAKAGGAKQPHRLKGDVARLRGELLAWYDANRRDLPWRRSSDPYSIWVSEIMLQQTRVAVVVERYQAFMLRFPTVPALARAGEQEVLALWSGLGYYRRARMLHQAAQLVVAQFGGNLPVRSSELKKLPGIGAYTAAAIASIAHGEPVAVVDGNVERVLCRLAGWDAVVATSAAKLRRQVEALAGELLNGGLSDPARPGDFNQAMMELGATVCLPRNPQCLMCPLAVNCKTLGEHKTAPRAPMQSREVGYALAVRVSNTAGADGREILLEQRGAEQTVMPGLWELPRLKDGPIPEADLRMTVRHAIMQVNYVVRVRTVPEDKLENLTVKSGARRWAPLGEAAGMALTGLARKVLTRAHLLAGTDRDAVAATTDFAAAD